YGFYTSSGHGCKKARPLKKQLVKNLSGFSASVPAKRGPQTAKLYIGAGAPEPQVVERRKINDFLCHFQKGVTPFKYRNSRISGCIYSLICPQKITTGQM
ncbi:MAG: hypothetical protein ACLUOS_19555, partial [Odoribacter splanchnicus]